MGSFTNFYKLSGSLILAMTISWKYNTFFIFLFSIFATNLVRVKADDNCDVCSMHIGGVIESLQSTLQDRDPLDLKSPDPCSKCNFFGISTVQLAGEVCSEKKEINGDTCYDHRIQLKFTNITLICTCSLPCDPAEVAKMAADQAKNPQGGMLQCAEPGATPVDPKSMTDIPKMNPMDLMKLKECQPKPPSMKNLKKPPQKCDGSAITQYTDFKFEATLRSCVKNTQVQTVQMKLDEDCVKNAEFKCEGVQEYKDACKCFSKTGFTVQLMTQAVKMLFPCYGDKQMSANQDVVQQLVCNDYVEKK